MNALTELRRQMNLLMRERGIRTLDQATNPQEWKSRLEEKPDPRPFFTGYEYGRLYGWDQYFEGILQVYAGWELTYIRHSLQMFLDRTGRDGFVPRTLPLVWWGMFHQQPFLAQQALLLQHAGDDMMWFYPEYYYHLKAYLLHWLRDLDVRGEGLSVWDHAGHSGMDNHYERAGTFRDAYGEGVDVNAYLVRECSAFARLAERCKQAADAREFRQWTGRKRDALNRWCWNEEQGCYLDYHARENHQIPVKHVGMFATLWARVCDEKQAKRLVKEHLMNPAEFWRAHPLPALAATEPGYREGYLPEETISCCSWRAHSWMPTNYYSFQGLRYYGFADEARALAQRNEAMFRHAPFREYYGADTGKPYGRDPFWGWSSLALYMMEELEKDNDPTRLD